MAKILNWKAVREIAKMQNKQVGKDFIELLDRQIHEKIEKMITDVRFKRLTGKDLMQ